MPNPHSLTGSASTTIVGKAAEDAILAAARYPKAAIPIPASRAAALCLLVIRASMKNSLCHSSQHRRLLTFAVNYSIIYTPISLPKRLIFVFFKCNNAKDKQWLTKKSPPPI